MNKIVDSHFRKNEKYVIFATKNYYELSVFYVLSLTFKLILSLTSTNMTQTYIIQPLPLPFEVETKEVLKKTTTASRALAELKSLAKTIPNEVILINTLVLQEAKDSSEIENIITTHDELFKATLFENLITSVATKEVQNYANALRVQVLVS